MPNAVGRTLNLGSGTEISIGALSQADRARRRGCPRAGASGDLRRLLADSTAARETLGFEARVSFDEGLAILTEWYEHHCEPVSVLLKQEVVHNWKLRWKRIPLSISRLVNRRRRPPAGRFSGWTTMGSRSCRL